MEEGGGMEAEVELEVAVVGLAERGYVPAGLEGEVDRARKKGLEETRREVSWGKDAGRVWRVDSVGRRLDDKSRVWSWGKGVRGGREESVQEARERVVRKGRAERVVMAVREGKGLEARERLVRRVSWIGVRGEEMLLLVNESVCRVGKRRVIWVICVVSDIDLS